MALVSSVDYVAKKIYLGAASVGVTLDALDIYREVVELRRLDIQIPYPHRNFKPMIVQGGNIQKTAVAYTAPYCQLLYGCEIIPYDATQTLTLVRDTFSDDGRAGAQCYNTSGFSNVVNFVEAVEKVEVREVATGGSTAPTVQEIRIEMDTNSTKLSDIRKMLIHDTIENGDGIHVVYEDDGITTWKLFDLKDGNRVQILQHFTVDITVDGDGVVDVASGNFPEGATLTVTATPNPGSLFRKFVKNGVDFFTNPIVMTVVGAIDLVPTFVDKIDLSMRQSGYGSVTPAVGEHEFGIGSTITLAATAQDTGTKEDSYFEGFDVGGSLVTQNPYDFDATVDILVQTLFRLWVDQLLVFHKMPVTRGNKSYFGDYSGQDNDVLVKNVRVGTFGTVQYIQTGKYLIGQQPIDFTINVKTVLGLGTKRLLLAGGDSNSNKGIYVYNGAGNLQIFISNGTGRQQISPGTLSQEASNKIRIVWNGLIGGSVSTYVNDILLNKTIATHEWVGNSAITANIGSSGASIDGFCSYAKIDGYFEYALNHGQGSVIYNLLGGTNGTITGAVLATFWGSTADGIEPYDTTLGATLYRNISTGSIMPICANVAYEISGYERLGYFAPGSGILKGLPNKYNIPVNSVLNNHIPAGDYTADELSALVATLLPSDRIQITEDAYSIKKLRVREKEL